MAKEILINIEEKEKRVALLDNNKLIDFFIEHPEDRTIVGNIYKGRVADIVPSVGAAFVDIGEPKKGFLYLNDIVSSSFADDDVEERPSQERNKQQIQLTKGQEILVQVTKEPFSGKGARLTTHLSIPGRYLVLMPFEKHVGISKKIDEPEERRRIRDILQSLNLGKDYGLIVRTAGWGREKKAFVRDLHFLLNLWDKIQSISKRCRPPHILYEDYDVVLRVVRDYFTEDVERLYVDSKFEYKRIYRFVSAFFRPLVKKIVLHRDSVSLFDKRGIEKEIERIFGTKIFLPCGGYIIIEQTEGLIVVDVNSGGFKQKKLLQEDTAFLVNCQAAEEAARQLQLRDLSGIIVIDFIDMQSEAHRKKLLKILNVALSEDKAKTDVVGISRLGLVEMTRERVHRSLESISYKDCPYCKGKGKVKSETSMVNSVLRKARNALLAVKGRTATIALHPDVAAKILHENRYSLKMLERKFRKKITVLSDASLHIEDMRIT